MNRLSDWLNTAMESRGWSLRETARRAELSPSAVSDVAAGKTAPSFDFCLGIARAFDAAPEDVLRRAGLLPQPPGYSPLSAEILGLFAKLSPADQQELVEIARLKLERVRREQRARRTPERR